MQQAKNTHGRFCFEKKENKTAVERESDSDVWLAGWQASRVNGTFGCNLGRDDNKTTTPSKD